MSRTLRWGDRGEDGWQRIGNRQAELALLSVSEKRLRDAIVSSLDAPLRMVRRPLLDWADDGAWGRSSSEGIVSACDKGPAGGPEFVRMCVDGEGGEGDQRAKMLMGVASALAWGEDTEARGPEGPRLEGIGWGRGEVGAAGCRVWASLYPELISVGKEGTEGRSG